LAPVTLGSVPTPYSEEHKKDGRTRRERKIGEAEFKRRTKQN
jgi:hypothetical protein